MGEKVRTFWQGRWQATGLVALPMVFLFACRQYQPIKADIEKPGPAMADHGIKAQGPAIGRPEKDPDNSVFTNQELRDLSRQAMAPAMKLPDDPGLKVNLPDGSVSLSSKTQPLKMDVATGFDSIRENGQAIPKALIVPPPSPESAGMYPRGYYGN